MASVSAHHSTIVGSAAMAAMSASVVEVRARPLIGQDAAVHHAADHDSRSRAPCTTAAAQRSGVLIEQGVAPATRKTSSSVSRANRASIADWFIPTPMARTTPCSRSRCSGGIGAVDRGLPMVVGIVDEDHVDPLEPEPLETLLERPATPSAL